ncbi:MAG: methionine ABC transporter ATP-binding protein [Tagaea sp. CACIAM 22H2]|nr:methionine ABC transporter ATP-binding protein [Tagaea sp. CACIAM 22H2]
MSALLEIRDLATHFASATGTVKAVDGVSFDVNAGEIVGLVGESGSGKTITGFSILGLIDAPGRIVAGSIKLEGRELVGLSQGELRKLRGKRIAMVFQDPSTALNPVLSIGEQMRMALAAHESVSRAAADERARDLLARVGIPEPAKRLDAYPHQLSGGMRQRVAIAIALLNRPSLIVCDEPTTALDVSIQAQILAEMRDLARDFGTALIWISHDLATVSALASRLIVMYAGRIVEDGPIGAILRSPRHPYTRGLLDSLPSMAAPGQELRQIPGSMPSLANLPPGCAFAPRCTHADAACNAAPPERRDGERGWRCHHPLIAVPA